MTGRRMAVAPISIVLLSIFQLSLALEDLGRSAFVADVIKARGFISELHVLRTASDVPINLHRIINPLANFDTLNKYPVLYGHGLLYDSQSMVGRSENSRPRKPILGNINIKLGDGRDNSDDYCLPFMFSNNNFDVWLFDSRGTNDGNRNISTVFDFRQAQRTWDFSLDDEALVDLPLVIDYILAQTAATKLIYVGYSESTLFMFALQSARPEYADKILAFIAMAPVAYVSNIHGTTIPILLAAASWVPEFIHASTISQPLVDTVDVTLRNMCSQQALNKFLCKPLVDSIGGQGSGESAPTFFNHVFKTTSVKAVKQFLQLYMDKKFRMYDYGEVENQRIYGQREPPRYDLGRVRLKGIILARGTMDFLSDPVDQNKLISELGTKPYLDLNIPGYNHFDFVDGRELIRLINAPVMTAVFELMFREGPNILKNPLQIQQAKINRAQRIKAGNIIEAEEIAPDQMQRSGLMQISRDFVKRFTGGSGIFNDKFLADALGK